MQIRNRKRMHITTIELFKKIQDNESFNLEELDCIIKNKMLPIQSDTWNIEFFYYPYFSEVYFQRSFRWSLAHSYSNDNSVLESRWNILQKEYEQEIKSYCSNIVNELRIYIYPEK